MLFLSSSLRTMVGSQNSFSVLGLLSAFFIYDYQESRAGLGKGRISPSMWHSPPSGIGTLGCDVDCTTAKKLYWPVLHKRKTIMYFSTDMTSKNVINEDKVHLYWYRQRHCVRSNCTSQCTSAQGNPVLFSYTNLTYIYHM